MVLYISHIIYQELINDIFFIIRYIEINFQFCLLRISLFLEKVNYYDASKYNKKNRDNVVYSCL